MKRVYKSSPGMVDYFSANTQNYLAPRYHSLHRKRILPHLLTLSMATWIPLASGCNPNRTLQCACAIYFPYCPACLPLSQGNHALDSLCPSILGPRTKHMEHWLCSWPLDVEVGNTWSFPTCILWQFVMENDWDNSCQYVAETTCKSRECLKGTQSLKKIL